ncbi:MAG: monofunctional biosynthetic peptidoglycan transglycosylase [Xanthomonadales bacterium PRO7]|jgi:monofunctional biosynthetic peptidoglycan transglycosylase|nr:monofunctional biosynthetic peptidoglycan transglycosylase [Xanthomonadales bacterium PRO7]HMM57023.1 monofunctional biosynthetic peptidoglycan transglycosylase [Rudaea sp.]
MRTAQTHRRHGWPRRIWRWAWRLALAWVALTWLVVAILRFVPPPTSAFMLERRIAAWHAGEKNFTLRYHWVPWREISPQLPIALIASEDQKFPYHHGFDVQAIQDALDEADEGERLRGASTISQQTAKNLFLWSGRSFVRKGLEAYFTVLLEITWPKQRILEVYTNIAEFGDGIYGADAAAHTFFREAPSQLDAYQSALLASVLPNPKRLHADRPSPYVLNHAQWTQRQVRQLGGIGYLPR